MRTTADSPSSPRIGPPAHHPGRDAETGCEPAAKLVRPLAHGKLRAFERLFALDGTLLLLAADHGSALTAILAAADPSFNGACAELRARHALIRMVAPVVDGIVLDPSVGASSAIAGGLLPRDTALLLRADGEPAICDAHGVRTSPLRAGWDAHRAHDLGAVGAKFLMYHRPDRPEATARQAQAVAEFLRSCRAHHLVALVECRTYEIAGESAAEIDEHRPDFLIAAVAEASALGADVVAIQWPAHAHDARETALLYERVDAASDVPWLLAGTPNTDVLEFASALRVACRAGASGALAGRLLWKDALARPEDDWEEWLETVARPGAMFLRSTIREHGSAWWHKHGDVPSALGFGG